MRVLAAVWFVARKGLPVQRVADMTGSCACAGLRVDSASTQAPLREIHVHPLRMS